MKKIAILLHKRDTGFNSLNYLVKLLMREWVGMGLEVETVRGTSRVVPAHLLIPHIDLTLMPKAYRAFASKYGDVINARVFDISKSAVSSNLLAKGGDYDGPVIVKTERNHGGLPEQQIAPQWQRISSLPGRALCELGVFPTGRTAFWKRVQHFAPGTYPIFRSLRDVPEDVFRNHALIVEKFLPEIEDGRYLVRQNFFFAEKEFNSVLRSSEPVVKLAKSVQTVEGSTPREIHSFRRRLGIDYGKIDWVRQNGNAVIFDFNSTPTISG